MAYLIKSKSKRKTLRNFILVSYRPEKEILIDLDRKLKNRPPTHIEKRIRKKIRSRLKRDGITLRELYSTKNWKVDGKDFRQMLGVLNMDLGYAYVFGSSSHAIHGDWYDISLHQLTRQGRYYQPKLEFDDPDPRVVCPITMICLDVLLLYLKWSNGDPDEVVQPIVRRIRKINLSLDQAHEMKLTAAG